MIVDEPNSRQSEDHRDGGDEVTPATISDLPSRSELFQLDLARELMRRDQELLFMLAHT